MQEQQPQQQKALSRALAALVVLQLAPGPWQEAYPLLAGASEAWPVAAARGESAEERTARLDSRICDRTLLPEVLCPYQEHGVDWGLFLEDACRYCTPGQPCEGQPTSEPLVERMQTVFQQDVPFKCIPGLLSAMIVSSQFFLVQTDMLPEVQELMRENWTLAPFPFHTLQYSLYANMVPARLMMCDRTLWDFMPNVYVPRVHPENSGRCGMVYDDRMLVYKCRSKRPYSRVPSRMDIVRGMRCPDAEIRLEPGMTAKLEKYGRRAQAPSDSCQSSKGMWREPMSDVHKCVLITVAHMLDFRPGQLVLDWGSGCGHKLTWAKTLFDVDGVGLDVEGGAVAWARKHSAGMFCHADGRHLDWVPDGKFDHIISYAALYHMSKTDQCHTGIQLVQKLRIGGRAWFGWNQAYSMNAWEWRSCFMNASVFEELSPEMVEAMRRMEVDFQGVEDGFLFPPSTEVAGNHYLYQFPAFSIILTRLA